MSTSFKRVTALALSSALVLQGAIPAATAQTAAAAVPMNLSAVPTFLGTNVLPNVLLVLDNSNSMDEAASGAAAGSADPASKSEIARKAAKTIIDRYSGRMNVGLMAYQQQLTGTEAVRVRQLHNSYYDVSYNPATYDPNWTGARGDPNHKRFRSPNPSQPANYIYYNVAAPFYQDAATNDHCYSATANAAPNAAHPEGFWNTESVLTGPWDSYICYSQKTGTVDGNVGYAGLINSGPFSPTDSDFAMNIYDFGRQLVDSYIGPTWFSNASPGRGYLHVPISAPSAERNNNLLTKLGKSQFATNGPVNSALPLQNAGLTPMEGTLLTAKDYFKGPAGGWSTASEGYTAGCYPPNSCGKNFVVFLTDGLPSTKANGSLIDSSASALTEATAAAGALKADGVETYMIGFALPYGVDPHQLDTVARAGGTGQAYSAADSSSLDAAMSAIFSDILVKSAAAAAVASNSTSVGSDTMVYQAKFDPSTWSGQLMAYKVDANGQPASMPTWTAANQLPAFDSRKIFTYKPSTKAGIAFRWPANAGAPTSLELDAAQVTQVGTASILNYLRGDGSNEGAGTGQFRVRPDGKLGDIVNSGPVYMGKPRDGYFDSMESSPYSAFVSGQSNRTPMVYVGANDGMLHAFNATTGVEAFAYVPSMVYSKLQQLKNQSYAHEFFVDGSPTVTDAFIGGAWKTLLVGGLNAGGQGIYALDVTDPTAVGEGSASSRVLWEFTDRQTSVAGPASAIQNYDADLGFTFGTPKVVKTRAGWVAIFGNGYNNVAADGAASSSGNAVLYVVDLATGKLLKKFDTGRGFAQSLSRTTPNGLSSPAVVDVDGNGVVDLVYAGDLQGNLWKFDLNSSSVADWSIAYGDAPLITAKTASGVPQPITSEPEVGRHPQGGYFVYFGTGKSLEYGDNANALQNSFYGIWDHGAAITTSRSKLLQQTITEEVTASGAEWRLVSNNAPVWTGNNPSTGWYIDLPTSLERQITDSILRGGRIIFVTSIPDAAICKAGGTSWLMELDAQTGGYLDQTPFDVNADGYFSNADFLAVTGSETAHAVGGKKSSGLVSMPRVLSNAGRRREAKIMNSSTGDMKKEDESEGTINRRVSWRDISAAQ